MADSEYETWHDPDSGQHIQFIPQPVMTIEYEALVNLLEMAGLVREERVNGL